MMPKKLRLEIINGRKKRCQSCKNILEFRDLVVHHKDGNNKNNQRNNLVVCCRPCHNKKIHSIYSPKRSIEELEKEIIKIRKTDFRNKLEQNFQEIRALLFEDELTRRRAVYLLQNFPNMYMGGK